MIETMRSINFVKRITSFRCEGVDSKAIIMGLRRCVKENGGKGMGVSSWKENGKIKLMIIVGCRHRLKWEGRPLFKGN